MKKLITIIVAIFAMTINVVAAQVPAGKLNAYFTAPYMDAAAVEQKLLDAGFVVLGKAEVGKSKNTSIVFSCANIKKMADAPLRGHLAGALRVLVNKEANEIRISNPKYFIKAFLQKEYKAGSEEHPMMMLEKAFGTLTPTEDVWEEANLGEYHFMIGRPYYHEQIELATGASVAELVAKLKANAKEGEVVFETQLSENRTVFGVRLAKRTEKFADKIGEKNSGILPWQIVIEKTTNGATAYGLRADYLIAIQYPLLDLMGFASIMTAPDAVITDLQKLLQ